MANIKTSRLRSLSILFLVLLISLSLVSHRLYRAVKHSRTAPAASYGPDNITTILNGKWITPHAATRNIDFNSKNNTMHFSGGGENEDYTGTFSIEGKKITLRFNSKKQKDISLLLETDKASENNGNYINHYLINEAAGEYFVKSGT